MRAARLAARAAGVRGTAERAAARPAGLHRPPPHPRRRANWRVSHYLWRCGGSACGGGGSGTGGGSRSSTGGSGGGGGSDPRDLRVRRGRLEGAR
eukprot:5353269-Prymnesium_polylepis.1